MTQNELKSLLIYEPDTGMFYDKQGKRIGSYYESAGGYGLIGLKSKVYSTSSLAWLYMTGNWPKYQIDHIDTNRANDKWDNLREATISQNACNRKRRIDCSSGIKGLYFNKRYSRWEVSVTLNGVKHNTTFGESNLEKAIIWLENTRRIIHGEFANHG